MTRQQRIRKHSSQRRRKKQRLHLEHLEARLLLAGDLPPNRLEALMEQYSAADFSDGLNAFVGGMEHALDAAIDRVSDLPLIGDRLADGFEPLFASMENVRRDLSEEIEDAFRAAELDPNASLLELFESSVFRVLGPDGLRVLRDGSLPDDAVDISDVRSSGVDSDESGNELIGTEWIQWDVHLGHEYSIDLPFEIGLDLSKGLNANLFSDFGLQIDTSDGLRADLFWDLRLGFGVTLGHAPDTPPGFFINSGGVDQLGDAVEELRAGIDVYAAPPTDVFGNELTDADARRLTGEINLGSVYGQVEDGTVSRARISAGNAAVLATDTVSQLDYGTHFTLSLHNADGSIDAATIIHNSGGGETFAEFLTRLNLQLLSELGTVDGSPFPKVLVTADASGINGLFDQENGQGGPSLIFTSTTPQVESMSLEFHVPATDAELGSPSRSLGFLEQQYDDGRSQTIGFTGNEAMIGNSLLAELAAPAEGQIAQDVDFVLKVNAVDVPIVLRTTAAENEVESLDDLHAVLSERLSDALSQAGILPGDYGLQPDEDVVELQLVDDRFEFVANAAGLALAVDADGLDKSRLSVVFTVDATNPTDGFDPDAEPDDADQSTRDRLTWQQLKEKADAGEVADVLPPQLAATGAARFHVSTSADVLPGFVAPSLGLGGGALGLPEVDFDLKVDASATLSYDSNEGFQFEKNIDQVLFDNILLDVGPLLSTVVAPIANTAGATIGPLLSVIGDGIGATNGFLNRPIPLLDIIGPPMGFGKPSILDLSGNKDELNRFFEAVQRIAGFSEDLNAFLRNYDGSPVSFGGLEYDIETGRLVPTELKAMIDSIDLQEFLALPEFEFDSGGLSIDILTPEAVTNMLLGQPFDIASFGLPTADFNLGADFGFDFKALSFGIHADANLHLGRMAFVYDSTGLEQIADAARAGAEPDFADLRDGFYIANEDGRELSLSLSVGGGGGVDVFVFFANAHASLGGELFFDLVDPNEDGKLRLNEINAVTGGFSNPQDVIRLFEAGVDIEGNFDIRAGGRYWAPFKTRSYSISLGGLGIPNSFNVDLSLSDILGYSVDENAEPDTEPSLAAIVNENGQQVLRIHAGPFATDRVHGNTDDSGGINVSGTEGSIVITAHLPGQGPVTQSFTQHVDRIVIVGTESADQIDFSGLNGVAVEVHALGGNDTIRTGGGNDLIFAGDGNDIVYAGAGDDLVLGEDGDDQLHGEAGRDAIDGGQGNDIIDGGSEDDLLSGYHGDDTIRTGHGNDHASGGRGNDLLISVAGIDELLGDRGDDTLQIDHRSHVRMDGGAGSDTLRFLDAQADFNDDQPLNAVLTDSQVQVVGGFVSPYENIEAVDITLGSRADVLTILSTSAPVHVDGSIGITEPDTVVVNRKADTRDRSGELTGVTLRGLGLDEIRYNGLENLTLHLSSGDDEFTVRGTAELTTTTIHAGTGDDSISIESVGTTKLTQLLGEEGEDEAILRIPGNPTEFGQLGVAVERLVVDNAASANSVKWQYRDGRILADGRELVDALGAELVVFTAGTGNSDSLLVEDSVDNPQVITIESDQVEILEGVNLLRQDVARLTPFDTAGVAANIDGLAGSIGIDSSPDGEHIYITGGGHIAVYRRQRDPFGNLTPLLEFVQILHNGFDGVQGMGGAQDVVVSPDGRDVYVASYHDASIVHFERIAATGRLVYKGHVHLPHSQFSEITMSRNDLLHVSGATHLYQVSRNPINGAVAIINSVNAGHPIAAIASPPDGNDMYVATIHDLRRYGPGLDFRGSVAISGNRSLAASNTAVHLGRTDSTFRYNRHLGLVDVRATPFNTDVTAVDVHPTSGFVITARDTTSTILPPPDVEVSDIEVRVFDQEDRDGPGDTVYARVYRTSGPHDPGGVLIAEDRFREGVVYNAPGRTKKFSIPPIIVGGLGTNQWLRLELLDLDNVNEGPFGSHPSLLLRGMGTVTIATDNVMHIGEAPTGVNAQHALRFLPPARQGHHPLNFLDSVAATGPLPWGRIVTLVGTSYEDPTCVFPGICSTPNSSDFHYQLIYDVELLPRPPLPPELDLYAGHAGDPGIQRDLFGNAPGIGATRIDDVTLTNDHYSYSIDASRSALYINHNPHAAGILTQGQLMPLRALDKAGDEFATTVRHGNTAYTLSSKLGTLSISDATTGHLRQRTVIPGLLHRSSLAVSDNGQQLFALNPTEDALLFYNLHPSGVISSGPHVLRDGVNFVDGLDHANSIAVSGNRAFVTSPVENSLTMFDTAAATMVTKVTTDLQGPRHVTTSDDGKYVYVTSETNHRVVVFRVDGNSLVHVQSVVDDIAGVAGLTGPTSSTISHDQQHVYVAGRDDTIAVFARDQNSGELSFVQALRNGSRGIQGLDGLSSLALTDDGDYLFAAGAEADTVAVFARDAKSGELRFVQRVRNGSAGVVGLNNPTSLQVVGNQLMITTGGEGGPLGDQGGIAYLQIDTSIPDPNAYHVTYDGVESLTVRSANSSDLVSVRDIVIATTVETRGADDEVVIHRAPEQLATIVRLGDDHDTAVLRESSDGAQVFLHGEQGHDVLRTVSTGNGTTVLDGGMDDDTFIVDGTTLGAELTVLGDGGNNRLNFDAKSFVTDPLRNEGPTGGAGFFGVDDQIHVHDQFAGITFAHGVDYKSIQFVDLIAAPTADSGGPYAIGEGDALALQASNLGGDPSVSYVWDLDGDGQFGEALGANPVVPWTTLYAAGINDNGQHRIAVRASNAQGSDEAYATVSVSNTPPSLIVTGNPSVIQYVSYVLELSATDSGNDTVSDYSVDWGDGSPVTTVAASKGRLLHTYTQSGAFSIRVAANDEDGGPYVATKHVDVIPGPPPTRTLSGSGPLDEGGEFALTLEAAGPGVVSSWLIDWDDGTTSLLQGSGGVLHHTYADDGAYHVTAIVTDDNGARTNATNSLVVRVNNVAPIVAFDGSLSSHEGSAYTIQNLRATGDPGDDSIAGWIVDWGDGTSNSLAATQTNASHIYADDGNYQIRVGAVDEDGVYVSQQSHEVVVANVVPTLTTAGAETVDEGSPFSLQLSATDPGRDTIREWIIDWGDGSSPQTFKSNATTIEHVYADGDNQYVISASARDEDGLHTANTHTVNVLDVPPTPIIEADGLFDEVQDIFIRNAIDGTFVLQFAGESTPDIAFDASAAVVQQHLENLSSIGAGNVLVRAIAEGGYTVSFRKELAGLNPAALVMDASLLVGGEEFEVDVATVVEGGANAVEGSSFAIRLASNDPGPDPVVSWSIDWGDGNIDSGLPGDAKTAVHTYADDGLYSIVATLTNDDGSFTSNRLDVNVANVEPTIAITGEVQQHATDPFRLTLGHVTDPGDDTVREYQVTWGDGSTYGDNTFETFTSNGVVEHVFEDGASSHTITVTLVDEDGIFAAAATLLVVNEGSLAPFLLSALGDPTSRYVVEWGDGNTTVYTNDDARPDDNGLPMIEAAHAFQDNGVYTATVFVERANGNRLAVREVPVVVNNVDPVLTSVQTSSPRCGDSAAHDTITLFGSLTDEGSLDSHQVLIDWDDGTTSLVDIAANGGVTDFAVDHVYTTGGVFEITATLHDDDGGVDGPGQTVAFVTGLRLTDDGVLQIVGTRRRDHVLVDLVTRRSSDGGSDGDGDRRGRRNFVPKIRVTTHLGLPAGSDGGSDAGSDGWSDGHSDGGADKSYFDPDAVQRIQMHLCEGNDFAAIGGGSDGGNDGGSDGDSDGGSDGGRDGLAIPTFIEGGEGNDYLVGGSADDTLLGGGGNDRLRGRGGNDVLVGAAGHDRLDGDDGRDLLIGGEGRDDLRGGHGDDMLIAGSTSYDDDVAALEAVMAEWSSASDYATRVANVTGGGGSLAGHGIALDATTVHDDLDRDKLKGGRGRDLFFYHYGVNGVKDRAKDIRRWGCDAETRVDI